MNKDNNNLSILIELDPIPELKDRERLSTEEIFTIKIDYQQKLQGHLFSVINFLAIQSIDKDLDFKYEISSLTEIGMSLNVSCLDLIEKEHALEIEKFSNYDESNPITKLVN